MDTIPQPPIQDEDLFASDEIQAQAKSSLQILKSDIAQLQSELFNYSKIKDKAEGIQLQIQKLNEVNKFIKSTLTPAEQMFGANNPQQTEVLNKNKNEIRILADSLRAVSQPIPSTIRGRYNQIKNTQNMLSPYIQADDEWYNKNNQLLDSLYINIEDNIEKPPATASEALDRPGIGDALEWLTRSKLRKRWE